MVCDHEIRLSAKDVQKHPWMVVQDDLIEPEDTLIKQMFQNIIKYSKLSHFLRIVCLYMTRQMNEKDVQKYRTCFNHIDKSENGLLSIKEFISHGVSIGYDKQTLSSIFESLDLQQTKQLTYTQFIAGGLPSHFFVKDDNVSVVFKFFDYDKVISFYNISPEKLLSIQFY